MRFASDWKVVFGDDNPYAGVSPQEQIDRRLGRVDLASQVRDWEGHHRRFSGMTLAPDFHDILGRLLSKDRCVLSIGSRYCENKVPLLRDGYDIICSDIDKEIVTHFSEKLRVPYIYFDIFSSDADAVGREFRDILITGLDYALTDAQTSEVFARCRQLLQSRPGGRLIFALRTSDNPLIWFIENVVSPLEKRTVNLLLRLFGSQKRYVRTVSGYRRRPEEIMAFARAQEFRCRSIHYGGHGNEFVINSFICARFPIVARWVRRLDSRAHLLSGLIVFEFVMPG